MVWACCTRYPDGVGAAYRNACGLQALYRYRVKNIDIPEWRSTVFGHLLGFASRLSFIFGGALFSVLFLRHVPELNSSEGAIILLPRAAMLLASLFCIYCYTWSWSAWPTRCNRLSA